MVFLVGLGNPGKEYEFTRHNAGKMFTRYLAEHPVGEVEAIETECYMNESGSWLHRELQKRGIRSTKSTKGTRGTRGNRKAGKPHVSDTFGTSDTSGTSLIVAHDDLDIPLGKFKIQFGRGPRQHKGILSIEEALRTKEFWRVRLGIGGSQFQYLKSQISNLKSFGEDYVLSEFSKVELRRLHDVFTSARATLVQLFESNSPFPKIVEQ